MQDFFHQQYWNLLQQNLDSPESTNGWNPQKLVFFWVDEKPPTFSLGVLSGAKAVSFRGCRDFLPKFWSCGGCHLQKSKMHCQVDTSFAMLKPSEAAPQVTPEMSRFLLVDLGILRCHCKLDGEFHSPCILSYADSWSCFSVPVPYHQPLEARFRVGDRVTARVPMKITHEGRGYFNEVKLKIAWMKPRMKARESIGTSISGDHGPKHRRFKWCFWCQQLFKSAILFYVIWGGVEPSFFLVLSSSSAEHEFSTAGWWIWSARASARRGGGANIWFQFGKKGRDSFRLKHPKHHSQTQSQWHTIFGNDLAGVLQICQIFASCFLMCVLFCEGWYSYTPMKKIHRPVGQEAEELAKPDFSDSVSEA